MNQKLILVGVAGRTVAIPSGISPASVLAVIDQTSGVALYQSGVPALVPTWSGQNLTLNSSAPAISANDNLLLIYNDAMTGAIRDDGTSEGIIRTKIAQGELVKIGVNSQNSTNVTAGGATVSLQLQSNSYNSDGTSSGVLITVPAFVAATQAGATVNRTIYGKTIGVRFLRSSATPIFCVEIDGVSYQVNQPAVFDDISNADDDGEAYFIVAEDLHDGPHTARVIVTSDPAIASIQNLVLYGFIAERRIGYTEQTKVNDFGTTGTLTTSAVAIPRTTERYIRAVFYTNISGASATVTIVYSGVTIWQATLAAGASATFDLLSPAALSATHQASAGSAINFATLGANF